MTQLSINHSRACVLIKTGETGAADEVQCYQGSKSAEIKRFRSGIIAVSTGQYHSCVLDGAGKPHCWGGNYHGQLDITEHPSEHPSK